MTATHEPNSTIPTTAMLYFSFELGTRSWKQAFTIGLGQKARFREHGVRPSP
jgi:hypothetical protein